MVVRTYWFIKLVFPTPLSPRIITYIGIVLEKKTGGTGVRTLWEHTLSKTFFRDAMAVEGLKSLSYKVDSSGGHKKYKRVGKYDSVYRE